MNDPPEILFISPVSGEYRDPVMLASTFRDIDEDQIISITYEYSIDVGTTWLLIGEDSMPDAPIEWYSGLNNDNVLIRASAYDGHVWGEWYTTLYYYSIDDAGNQEETKSVQVWIGWNQDLPDGWSMISLPIMPENASVSSLFPDAVVVYGYEKGAGYVRVKYHLGRKSSVKKNGSN